MHDNPDREQRVRERAYHLWEADGKPHGRDVEYWQRARELVAIEDNGDAGRLPNPQYRADSIRETSVEAAEIQENLGDFPDRFADQGEVQPTPAPVHSPRRRRAAPVATARKPAAKPKKPR
ncbi:MAG TPA: DUF2934 domain-containing protein [Acetobacteraceae bacterium]|nr:DUF2934 domain-containing protein [Acetobacteraceae bacterium]